MRKILLNWLKFLIGSILIGAMFLFFSSGYYPPGIFGEVLRHNEAMGIDASPLFYSEVENMSEIEEGLRKLRESAATSKEPLYEK